MFQALLKLPSAVWLVGLISLVNDSASEMIYPLVPLYLTSVLMAGPKTLGLIEGIAEATSALLKLAEQSAPALIAGLEDPKLAGDLVFCLGSSEIAGAFLCAQPGWLNYCSCSQRSILSPPIRRSSRSLWCRSMARSTSWWRPA